MASDKKNKKDTNSEIEKLKKEAEDYKNRYLRALADYQNLEKRIEEGRDELVRAANRNFILKILPFLDNLEKAENFVKDAGLKMIKDQFLGILKNEGVEEVDLLGKEYDPHVAEAIDIVAGDKDNIVCEIVRKGYKLGDKILQPAQVKITKKSEARSPKSEINPNDQNV